MSVSIDAFTVLPNVVKGPSAATWQYILVASCSNWWKQEIVLHTIWEFNVFFVCFFVGPVFHLFEWIDISYKKTGVRCEWTSLELFQSISRMSAHTSGTNISSVASSRKWYDSLMSNSQHAGHIGQLPVHQPTLSALANEDTLNLNPHVVYHNSRRHSVDAGTNNWSPIEDGNIMKYPTFWLFCTDWGKGLWRMSSFLLPVTDIRCCFCILCSVRQPSLPNMRLKCKKFSMLNCTPWGKNRVSGILFVWIDMGWLVDPKKF